MADWDTAGAAQYPSAPSTAVSTSCANIPASRAEPSGRSPVEPGPPVYFGHSPQPARTRDFVPCDRIATVVASALQAIAESAPPIAAEGRYRGVTVYTIPSRNIPPVAQSRRSYETRRFEQVREEGRPPRQHPFRSATSKTNQEIRPQTPDQDQCLCATKSHGARTEAFTA